MQSGFRANDQSLAGLWAKKYLENLDDSAEGERSPKLSERAKTSERLLSRLRFCSSRAWTQTEKFLFKELKKHRLDPSHVDPWRIAEDSHQLFEKACESYQNYIKPEQFSVIISSHCGLLRKHHTALDPRFLGFLSMQFHYTGSFLLEELTQLERVFLADYFKVMDDHLYMPLQRAYDAAAQHAYHDPALMAVRQLLPISTRIAEYIRAHVAEQNPSYHSHTGSLSHPTVRVSSTRDIEMFQIYLCLCVLEGSITAVQQELFPLCIMLYPPLNVQWKLVRQLVMLLTQEIRQRLDPANYAVFAPYLASLQSMFSTDVLPDSPVSLEHNPVTGHLMDVSV